MPLLALPPQPGLGPLKPRGGRGDARPLASEIYRHNGGCCEPIRAHRGSTASAAGELRGGVCALEKISSLKLLLDTFLSVSDWTNDLLNSLSGKTGLV